MSEEREDTKPKINITIKYGGDGEKRTSTFVSMSQWRSRLIPPYRDNGCREADDEIF